MLSDRHIDCIPWRRIFQLSCQIFPTFFVRLCVGNTGTEVCLYLNVLVGAVCIELGSLDHFFVYGFCPVVSALLFPHETAVNTSSKNGITKTFLIFILILLLFICALSLYRKGLRRKVTLFLCTSSITRRKFPPQMRRIFSSLYLSNSSRRVKFINSDAEAQPVMPPSPSNRFLSLHVLCP